MVWFQCESCGENLKKPKLQNHFRVCASRKLSCIDCGVVFDQQSVHVHTSCVSETEKYGPKDGSSGPSRKPNSSHALKAGDGDLSIGLSTDAPWSCSLCKINATSYETLEGHSLGKKHRAKAKAAQAKINSLLVLEPNLPASNLHGISSESKASAENGSELVEYGKLVPTFAGGEWVLKKRKADGEESKLGETRKKIRKGEELLVASMDDCIIRSENGGVEKLEVAKSSSSLSRICKAVKWKKLTARVLLKAPEKGIELKELFKELLPLVTSGAVVFDKKTLEKQMVDTLNASSKFDVRGKWIALATTS